MNPRSVTLLAAVATTLSISSCVAPTPEPQSTPVSPNNIVQVPTQELQTATVEVVEAADTPTNQPTATTEPQVASPTSIIIATSTTAPTLTLTATSPVAASTSIPTTNTTPGRDPDLEPGFPIEVELSPDDISMVVGNINNDPQEEIVVATFKDETKQLLALKADGSSVPGWPASTAVHPDLALGNFSTGLPGLEVLSYIVDKRDSEGFASEWGINIHSGSGEILPSWPITRSLRRGESQDFYVNPPLVVDLDGDGVDEVFAGFHFYRSDGSIMQQWDSKFTYAAVGDINGDGKPEVVQSGSKYAVDVYGSDGSRITSFAPQLPDGWVSVSKYPVIGDVNGDGTPEIVTIAYDLLEVPLPLGESRQYALVIVSADGRVKHFGEFTSHSDITMTLALGDLDCDAASEIVLQTVTQVHVWKGDGSVLPGWPQDIGVINTHYSPLIGDIDGDGGTDIVVLSSRIPEQGFQRQIRAYNRSGQMLSHFPKALDYGQGAVAAIADVDFDGRNELIVRSDDRYDEKRGSLPSEIWMFDLHGPGPYGAVQWGQYLGGPKHQNYLKPGTSCSR